MFTDKISKIFFIALATLVLGATAVAGEGVPSGTLEIDGEQFRVILGGGSGEGVLHFQGKDYRFATSGMTVGGFGYTKLHATGEVYDLDDVAKFAGTYIQIGVGATVVGGKGAMAVKNTHGVSIVLYPSTEGLGLSLGAGGMEIRLKD